MSPLRRLVSQKLSLSFVVGLGVGIFVTTMNLMPRTTVFGDKYSVYALIGLSLLIVAIAIQWLRRRHEVVATRRDNLNKLVGQK